MNLIWETRGDQSRHPLFSYVIAIHGLDHTKHSPPPPPTSFTYVLLPSPPQSKKAKQQDNTIMIFATDFNGNMKTSRVYGVCDGIDQEEGAAKKTCFRTPQLDSVQDIQDTPSGPGETNMNVLSGNILSRVLGLCRPIERRVISTLSREGHEIYVKNAENISLGEISKLVLSRKESWALPKVTSTKAVWDQCLPEIAKGRKTQVGKYIRYQCESMAKLKGFIYGPESSGPDYSYAGMERVLRKDKLLAKFMTLHEMLVCGVLGDCVHDVLEGVAMDYSDGVVKDFFDGGGGTLVDIGMEITAGDGCFFPLGCVDDIQYNN